MSDIVERLTSPDEANDENICQLLDDAADEIERLTLTANSRGQLIHGMEEEIEKLIGIKDRLRRDLAAAKADATTNLAHYHAEMNRAAKLEMELNDLRNIAVWAKNLANDIPPGSNAWADMIRDALEI